MRSAGLYSRPVRHLFFIHRHPHLISFTVFVVPNSDTVFNTLMVQFHTYNIIQFATVIHFIITLQSMFFGVVLGGLLFLLFPIDGCKGGWYFVPFPIYL